MRTTVRTSIGVCARDNKSTIYKSYTYNILPAYTCKASSRVGTTISTIGPSPTSRYGWATIWIIAGKINLCKKKKKKKKKELIHI